MRSRKLFGFGIGGTAVTAVCCFTPALVILLGGLGLSAWLAWLDYVLLPMLAAFIALTLFALMRTRLKPKSGHRDD
jgi:mercuric ion transport protein